MKVLITTDWYRPAVNGVVTSVVNLQKQLLDRGVDVKILTLANDGVYHTDGNVIYLPSVDISRVYPGARVRLKTDSRAICELIQWHPDIVHSQCEFSTFHAARKIAGACGCPQVHTYHTLYKDFIHYVLPGTLLGKQGARILTASVCRKVRHIIVPSEKTKELLQQYHVRTPITCIPTGIEIRSFSNDSKDTGRDELRARYGIPEKDIVLLYAGRLAMEKNLDEILYLFSRWSYPSDKLVLVGDGPYRQELECLVRESGLTGRVVFTGMVSPQDIAHYYRMADIFVSASRSETQGLTYFEAMACGLPLLCLDDPCLDHVLFSGVNGFAYSNEHEYAEFLQMLSSSAALRKMMGNRGKEIIQSKYSAKAFAEAVLQVYRQVLGARSLQGRRNVYGTAANQVS
ncbi:MAG: glycosyltransferase family 4 protein [Eubacteriales bacterium]|jgi:1,2-diacylglycerol 3-alpha-glucosyltransferase